MLGITGNGRHRGVGPGVDQRAVPQTNAPRRMMGLPHETETGIATGGERGHAAVTDADQGPETGSAPGELCVRKTETKSE